MPNCFGVSVTDINSEWIKKHRVPKLIEIIPASEPDLILYEPPVRARKTALIKKERVTPPPCLVKTLTKVKK